MRLCLVLRTYLADSERNVDCTANDAILESPSFHFRPFISHNDKEHRLDTALLCKHTDPSLQGEREEIVCLHIKISMSVRKYDEKTTTFISGMFPQMTETASKICVNQII